MCFVIPSTLKLIDAIESKFLIDGYKVHLKIYQVTE